MKRRIRQTRRRMRREGEERRRREEQKPGKEDMEMNIEVEKRKEMKSERKR